MAREIAANHWTAAALGVFIIALHAWWFVASVHQEDVVTGFGGALTVLGILVAAQPYIRKGIVQTAREQVGLHDSEEVKRTQKHRLDEIEAEGVVHVLKERVVGVALIGAGSLLNAYGDAISHLLLLRGTNL